MNPLIVSYMTLRKSIGWLGITMPLTLVLMGWLRDDTGVLPSMSAYEAAMIGAFGYSWLVKGEALLADQGVT